MGRPRFPHQDGVRLWVDDPRPIHVRRACSRSNLAQGEHDLALGRSGRRRTRMEYYPAIWDEGLGLSACAASAIADLLFRRAHGVLNPRIRIGLRLPQGRSGTFRDVITH
jgi:hypothetical protein